MIPPSSPPDPSSVVKITAHESDMKEAPSTGRLSCRGSASVNLFASSLVSSVRQLTSAVKSITKLLFGRRPSGLCFQNIGRESHVFRGYGHPLRVGGVQAGIW